MTLQERTQIEKIIRAGIDAGRNYQQIATDLNKATTARISENKPWDRFQVSRYARSDLGIQLRFRKGSNKRVTVQDKPKAGSNITDIEDIMTAPINTELKLKLIRIIAGSL